MRHKTDFHFDTRQHPGCRVVCSEPIDDIVVTAKTEIYTALDGQMLRPHDIVGTTAVHGRLFGFEVPDPSPCDIWTQREPFDVQVLAYDPIADQDYQMDVTGCWIVDHGDGPARFNAVSVKRWRPMVAEPAAPVVPKTIPLAI